ATGYAAFPLCTRPSVTRGGLGLTEATSGNRAGGRVQSPVRCAAAGDSARGVCRQRPGGGLLHSLRLLAAIKPALGGALHHASWECLLCVFLVSEESGYRFFTLWIPTALAAPVVLARALAPANARNANAFPAKRVVAPAARWAVPSAPRAAFAKGRRTSAAAVPDPRDPVSDVNRATSVNLQCFFGAFCFGYKPDQVATFLVSPYKVRELHNKSC
ncbi:unnamed protein product, partial [Gulo gulo]